jgi:hypothetical protein
VDAQVRQLKAACAQKVWRETASGAKTDRVQLRRVLDRLDAGDVFVVTLDWRAPPCSPARQSLKDASSSNIAVRCRAACENLHTTGHKPDLKFVAAGHVPCGSRRHLHHSATGSLVRSGFVMRTSLSENQLFQGHALTLSWCLFGEWPYHLSSFLPMR